MQFLICVWEKDEKETDVQEQNREKKCYAVVLAAGSGSRMGSNIPKQYLPLMDKPVIWYSLQAFETSSLISECILVTGAEYVEYAKEVIVKKSGFQKVKHVIAGGAERFLSVQNALNLLRDKTGYVFIHDGARPMLSQEMIERLYREVCIHDAVCAAVPVKDTIKVADQEGFSVKTPDRKVLYAAQTPQVFSIPLICLAYEKLDEYRKKETGVSVTDDAMVAEAMLGTRVKLVEGSYQNIKITTPEDMEVAENYLRKKNEV